ncbi:MAG: RusA family crossover junction endodeoxyribonuclease [Isosphaeraceae bacterium]|jgi:crossover junction endodeoxyribonuclease RusA
MHLEFVVLGPPISNQSPGSNLDNWRATVEAEAKKQWNKAVLNGNLKAVIINFHLGSRPSVDIDNMLKPILDVMQKIVYDDDRQIRQAEISHVRIDAPFVFVGASKILVAAVQAGHQFVYVRIEDPVDPFPLPK